MKVNMADLLLAGLLDNDDELILLSQVCSGSDVPSFENFIELRFCLYLPDLSMETCIKKTYKSQIYFIHSLTDSQRVASILNL